MMQITPVNPTFVANIDGVDVCDINREEFDLLYQAWLDYGVLRLRNQPLDEDALQAFSAKFGPLEEIPMDVCPMQPARRSRTAMSHNSPTSSRTVNPSAAWVIPKPPGTRI